MKLLFYAFDVLVEHFARLFIDSIVDERKLMQRLLHFYLLLFGLIDTDAFLIEAEDLRVQLVQPLHLLFSLLLYEVLYEVPIFVAQFHESDRQEGEAGVDFATIQLILQELLYP